MVRGRISTPGTHAFVELDEAFVVANITSTEVTAKAGLYNPCIIWYGIIPWEPACRRDTGCIERKVKVLLHVSKDKRPLVL